MKRTEAVLVVEGVVADVPRSDVGDVDPLNDAVKIARRRGDKPYSPDVDQYEYEAVDHGPYIRVLVRGYAKRNHFGTWRSRGAGLDRLVRDFDHGGFDGRPDVLEWREVDVAEELMDELTVADLRELGREHGVSYKRGSTKRELIRQLIEQSPAAARQLSG